MATAVEPFIASCESVSLSSYRAARSTVQGTPLIAEERDTYSLTRARSAFSVIAAETPGSIHEGGELGYNISHALGTVFDNPDLITRVMGGAGETGLLAMAIRNQTDRSSPAIDAIDRVPHLCETGPSVRAWRRPD